MKTLTEFHQADRMVVNACQVLIDEGFTDSESYEAFVHLYMAPWFDQMRGVALRLAERGVALTTPHGVDIAELLLRMRATAHRQLNEAIQARNARAAAKAILFGCGVQLALNALDAEADF